MADFLSNFREALGMGKANHVTHLSDITDAQKQRWADERAANIAKRNIQPIKIENAKDSGNYWTTTGTPFNENYVDDNNNQTMVLNFRYGKPTDVNNIDSSAGKWGYGKVVVRAPRGASVRGKQFEYNKRGPQGRMGVYEAVLDDGTVLDADAFTDFLNSSSDGRGFKWGEDVETTDDAMGYYNQYKQSMEDLAYQNMSPFSPYIGWSKQYRKWMKHK